MTAASVDPIQPLSTESVADLNRLYWDLAEGDPFVRSRETSAVLIAIALVLKTSGSLRANGRAT